MILPLRHAMFAGVFILFLTNKLANGYDISPPIPIATPEPGFRYNPAGPFRPQARIDMFIDLNCPDSAAAMPILQSVADYYGNSQLDLVIQMLQLPYHRNAFLSSEGLFLINDELPLTVFAFINTMLQNTANFSTANTVDMTETEVLDMMADLAVSSTGIDRNLFIDNIYSYAGEAVQAWKYSIRKNNAGTPSYYINGVEVLVTGNPTLDEWIAFLDPIVSGNVNVIQAAQAVGKNTFNLPAKKRF